MSATVADNLNQVMGVHELFIDDIGYFRGTYADCVVERDRQRNPEDWGIRPWFDTSSWDAMTEQIVSARNKRAA